MGARGVGAPADEGGLGPVALAVLQASPLPVTIVRAATAAERDDAYEGASDETGQADA